MLVLKLWAIYGLEEDGRVMIPEIFLSAEECKERMGILFEHYKNCGYNVLDYVWDDDYAYIQFDNGNEIEMVTEEKELC